MQPMRISLSLNSTPSFVTPTILLAVVETAPQFDPHVVWQMVLSELALQMPPATYDTWVRDTVVMGYEDGEFIIGMPNAYARDWLENRLRHTIKRTLGSIMRRSVQIQFRVRPRPVQEQEPRGAKTKRSAQKGSAPGPLYEAMPDGTAKETAVTAPTPPSQPQPAPDGAGSGAGELSHLGAILNPQHTFETFVVGNHNRLAHAAALAIVDAPGQTFNPLFVYGGVGLGKTHLLNAIGNSMARRGYSTLYCSSEQFTNELIAAIRSQSTEAISRINIARWMSCSSTTFNSSAAKKVRRKNSSIRLTISRPRASRSS